MNAIQRKNLLKLAAYLESLPRDYKHFDMSDYAGHRGDCDLPESPHLLAATKPAPFFTNCGTVACAAGHGPAAGVALRKDEFSPYSGMPKWSEYSERAFTGDRGTVWEFLFDGSWAYSDNHHYGAAARIRYFLDTRLTHAPGQSVIKAYAPFRKGSRSAKRREIETASA